MGLSVSTLHTNVARPERQLLLPAVVRYHQVVSHGVPVNNTITSENWVPFSSTFVQFNYDVLVTNIYDHPLRL